MKREEDFAREQAAKLVQRQEELAREERHPYESRKAQIKQTIHARGLSLLRLCLDGNPFDAPGIRQENVR